jgi:hypothetical protein
VQPIAGAIERAEDAVDAVAGISIYPTDTPCMQPLQQEIGNCVSHGILSGRDGGR